MFRMNIISLGLSVARLDVIATTIALAFEV